MTPFRLTPEQRQRVEDLFDRLADQTLDAARSFLESECAADPDVRGEVMRLLAGSKGSDSPTADVRRGLEQISDTLDAELKVGDRVESYELLEKIASGGMGTVYRARQDLTNQIVALKVIRPGLLSPYLVRRFMFEVEVLGKLDHVGIARIYAAGIAKTSLGQQPYFAMEFVQGLPLDQFAQTNDLSTRQRVALLHRVAEAVNAAHLRGVIHRDLKPNNVLVNDSGQPKVLDFGVARATAADQPAGPALTLDTEGLIGTLPFMAPEQITSSSDQIDLETDVYALGVVGFLLLTGSMPYEVTGKPLHEASEIITEQEPRRPSSLQRALKGDIEAILLKALEKEKSQRYRSAGTLAEDLRRALNDEPVEARPISAWRRATKFARRNRFAVATVSAVIVSLAAGLIATGLALRRVERQRKIAESERENAQSVLRFFTGDVLGSAQPAESRGREITVAQVVDDASATVGSQFAGKPRIEAGVRQSIAQTYDALGKPKQAMPHLQRVLELLGPVSTDNAGAVLDAQLELGRAHALLGESAEAERVIRQNIADRTARFGPDAADTLQAQNELAVMLARTDRLEEAVALHQHVYDRTVAARGPDHAETLIAATNLYGAQEQLRRDGRTLPLVKQLLDRARIVLPPDHPAAIDANRLLGVMYADHGQLVEAVQCLRADWDACKRVYGATHETTALAGANLVAVLYINEQYPEAARIGHEVVEQAVAALGPTHPTTFSAKTNFAASLALTGHASEAEALARQTLDQRRAASGERSDGTRVTMVVLGVCLREQGKVEEAEALFKQSFDWVREERGLLHPATISQAMPLVEMQVRRERFDLVIETLEPIAEAAIAGNAVPPRYRTAILGSLVEAYEKTGQQEKAQALTKRGGLTRLPATSRPRATSNAATTSTSH